MTAFASKRLLAAATVALLASAPGTFALQATPAPARPSAPVLEVQADAQMAEQSMRMNRLEDQMRQLYGRIDELTYQVQQLQELLRRSREDTDFRLQELEGGARPQDRSEAPAGGALPSGGTLPSGGSVVTTGPADAPVELGNGFSMDPGVDPEVQYGAPPQVLGTVPAGSAGGAGPLDLSAIAQGQTWGSGGSGGSGDDLMPSDLPPAGQPDLGASVDSSLLPPPETGSQPAPQAGTQVAALEMPADPDGLYNAAYEHMVSGNYDLAETGFRRYLDTDGRGPKAADAWFWLGESYLARSRFRDAADAFLTTYREYPASAKAPDSLVKLGQSLEGLGEADAACATYRELEKKFPSASGALLRQVSDRKSAAGC